MSTYILTADVDLRYKLREKPRADRQDDGFPIKAGESIRITKEALAMFKAVDSHRGKATTKFRLTLI